jgi:hypothetical protein
MGYEVHCATELTHPLRLKRLYLSLIWERNNFWLSNSQAEALARGNLRHPAPTPKLYPSFSSSQSGSAAKGRFEIVVSVS